MVEVIVVLVLSSRFDCCSRSLLIKHFFQQLCRCLTAAMIYLSAVEQGRDTSELDLCWLRM